RAFHVTGVQTCALPISRVVVCDGFTGNVLLKAGEGAVDFLFAELRADLGKLLARLTPDDAVEVAGGLKALKSRYEYHEFGGGPRSEERRVGKDGRHRRT